MSRVAFRSGFIDILSCELDVVFGMNAGDLRIYVIIYIWLTFYCDDGQVGWEGSTMAFCYSILKQNNTYPVGCEHG
jgi:hypothetical protein